MIEGILIIDKPEGISSRVVLKKTLNLKKVGHTGTLDPFASGLLLICLNHATKKAGYFTGLDKTYLGTMILGISTDTQDLTGKVVKVNPIKQNNIEIKDIENAFQNFKEICKLRPCFLLLSREGNRLPVAREGHRN